MRAAGRAALLALVLAGLGPEPARAAELVLFETPTCPWCIKFHREVGGRYAGTVAGRLLPLRRVDVTKPRPADLRVLGSVRSIPTFIIVDCGREAARITGYSTEPSFWSELTTVVNRLKAAGGLDDRCPGGG